MKMPLGTKVGVGPAGDIVLDGVPAPPPQKRHNPQFLAHVYCGQTAGSIKMPLGTMVAVGPGDIALNGDPAPRQKNGTTSNFRPTSIVAKWLD